VKRRLLSAALALSFLCAGPARADSERREPPDYAGRPAPPATAGEVLLWVPRIILLPVYLVSEFLLRKPLGWVIAGAERAGVPAWLYDFFTFNDHKAGIVPTFLIDINFYASVGFYAFWNDAFVKNNDLRLRGSFGGGEWLGASFSERYYFSHDRLDKVALNARGERRPDFTYFGLGPDTRQSALVRYGRDLREIQLELNQRLASSWTLHSEVTLRDVDFRRGGYVDDPVLDDAIFAGTLTPPPGYEDGYTLLRSELGLSFDSRRPRPAPGSGLRVEAVAAHNGNFRDNGSFIYYGGGVLGSLDLNDRHRVLSLGVSARFADPIDAAEIPFTELPTLGGNAHPMRGLYEGRLYDRSAVVAGIGYRWPIWIWLDGSLRTEVGNVFGEHLSGFQLERLRWSGSIGVESVGTPDNSFQLSFGVGSETFESGGKIDSFRLVAGTTSGF